MRVMDLGVDASHWALLHGLVVSNSSSGSDQAQVAPVSLRPGPFPKRAFMQAKELAKSVNAVMMAVSNRRDVLLEAVQPAAVHDDFTKRLVDLLLCEKDTPRPVTQCRLGILRADYMLDASTHSLLQVEINTIASSFGALATRTSEMHRYLHREMNDQLPENDALKGIADAIAAAKKNNSKDHESDIVLFVVQPGETNIFDQLWLADHLWAIHGVRSKRATLAEVATRSSLDEDGNLMLEGCRVAVAYFRAGYSPDDYPSEVEWEARARIHFSNACECPDVALHLAGTKKVQQALAYPGVLEKLLGKGNSHVAVLRECFAGLWSLEGPEGTVVIQDAMQDPCRYVLKPQREGGGNNIYGVDILPVLRSQKGLGGYILMQRIFPPLYQTQMLRNGNVTELDTVSELGVYSVFLEKDNELLLDQGVGHLLRTKAADSDEGGVAAGFAVLDSPLLVDDDEYWASV